MKLTATITTLLVLTVGTSLFADGQANQPGKWGENSQVGRLYNPTTVETQSGKIVNLEKARPRPSRWHAVVLFLKTPKEDNLEVHLGPQWFLEENNLALQPNDDIEVTGSRITVGGKTFIVAKQISKGDQSLVIRKDNGKPAWTNSIPKERPRMNQTRNNQSQ